MVRTARKRKSLSADVLFVSIPGPTRKRTSSPYCYRLVYQTPTPMQRGCALMWEVLGGRDVYQVALERQANGRLRWHCTCPDAVYRGEDRPHTCKHVRGLQSTGRHPPPWGA